MGSPDAIQKQPETHQSVEGDQETSSPPTETCIFNLSEEQGMQEAKVEAFHNSTCEISQVFIHQSWFRGREGESETQTAPAGSRLESTTDKRKRISLLGAREIIRLGN